MMSGLPSWFRSAMAIEPGPFPTGITIRLKPSAAGVPEGRRDAAMARAARSAAARLVVKNAVFTSALWENHISKVRLSEIVAFGGGAPTVLKLELHVNP